MQFFFSPTVHIMAAKAVHKASVCRVLDGFNNLPELIRNFFSLNCIDFGTIYGWYKWGMQAVKY